MQSSFCSAAVCQASGEGLSGHSGKARLLRICKETRLGPLGALVFQPSESSAASGRRRPLQRSQRRRAAALRTAPAAPATELRTDLGLSEEQALSPQSRATGCGQVADRDDEGGPRLQEKRIPGYLHTCRIHLQDVKKNLNLWLSSLCSLPGLE